VGKGGVLGLLTGVVAALLGLSVIGFDSIIDVWRALIIMIAAFGMVGGVAAWALGRVLMPKGMKDQRARETYPSVMQKVREGWKVGPKPPGL
jgi:hypothetical protein